MGARFQDVQETWAQKWIWYDLMIWLKIGNPFDTGLVEGKILTGNHAFYHKIMGGSGFNFPSFDNWFVHQCSYPNWWFDDLMGPFDRIPPIGLSSNQGFHKWGYPQMVGYKRKSHLEMDDEQGSPMTQETLKWPQLSPIVVLFRFQNGDRTQVRWSSPHFSSKLTPRIATLDPCAIA